MSAGRAWNSPYLLPAGPPLPPERYGCIGKGLPRPKPSRFIQLAEQCGDFSGLPRRGGGDARGRAFPLLRLLQACKAAAGQQRAAPAQRNARRPEGSLMNEPRLHCLTLKAASSRRSRLVCWSFLVRVFSPGGSTAFGGCSSHWQQHGYR